MREPWDDDEHVLSGSGWEWDRGAGMRVVSFPPPPPPFFLKKNPFLVCVSAWLVGLLMTALAGRQLRYRRGGVQVYDDGYVQEESARSGL